MVPCQNSDFDSKSLGDYYFSAPTSPNCHHLPPFYKDFDELSIPAAVPFAWEEKPGLPKSADDFVFDVSQDWETASLSAEDLFDGGVIKPMITPPPAEIISESLTSPPCQTRKVIQKVGTAKQVVARPRRGRERGVSKSRAARSLSPLRDRDKYPWEKEEEKDQPDNGESIYSAESPKEQKKWTLMNFFLFRSASEGRAADRDPLKKYTAAALRRSSFRTIESPGSRKRGHISAHELHYTVNRAVSEDLKRKTFLPYKQGILGRLAFNPAVHALANGFGLSRKRSDTNNI